MTGSYRASSAKIRNALETGAENVIIKYEHDAYATEADEECPIKIPVEAPAHLSSLRISQLQLARLLRLPASTKKKALRKKTTKQGRHFEKKSTEMLRIAKRIFEKNRGKYFKLSGSLNQKELAKEVHAALEKSTTMQNWFSVRIIADKLGENRSLFQTKQRKK